MVAWQVDQYVSFVYFGFMGTTMPLAMGVFCLSRRHGKCLGPLDRALFRG